MWIIEKYWYAKKRREAYIQGMNRAFEKKSSPHGFLNFIGDLFGLPGFKEREQGYHDVVKHSVFANIYHAVFKNSAKPPKKRKQQPKCRNEHRNKQRHKNKQKQKDKSIYI